VEKYAHLKSMAIHTW